MDPWNVMDWTNLSLLIVWVVMRSLIWIEAIGIELGAQELLIDDHYTPMQCLRAAASETQAIRRRGQLCSLHRKQLFQMLDLV